jgi:twitching motility protein PilT
MALGPCAGERFIVHRGQAEIPMQSGALEQLLSGMTRFDASDLHLKVGYCPYYRVAGELKKVDMAPIASSAEIEQVMAPLVPEKRKGEYETQGDLDFSYQAPNGNRFRINIFRSGGQMHAAIRRVQSVIPSFSSLRLPSIYEELIDKTHAGLLLVSGVTGSGKSSTLAAMLDHINATRSVHIITIEDPVEFVFKPKKSVISQREIGTDIPDYDEALKYVVRQDPDVVFIGEMRDAGTMLASLQAAETGHLVMGSIHCADAPATFARILEYFPQDQHEFIRSSLANSMAGICCQRLLPAIDEKIARVPAAEVLIANGTVRDKIRRGEDEDLAAIIAASKEDGMRNFTQSLCELVEAELVYYDTAMKYAPNREALQSAIQGITTASTGLVGRMGRK